MSELHYWKALHAAGRISRREFLGRAIALGASAALISSMVGSLEAIAAETPKKGGRLKVGMVGGSTTDSMDPTTYTDSVALFAGFACYNGLVENGADNKPVAELAESWEAKPGATEWILNLRKGVTFSNGKIFDADDVIYSLNLHRGETKSGASGPMKIIKDVKKLSPNQVSVELNTGDADFVYVLTDYHLLMVPKDFKDWANPIGTGAFALEKFDPGVRVLLKKTRDYWKPGKGNLDGVDVTVISDASAKLNALVSGQVDVINRVDPKTVALLSKSSKIDIVQAPGGWHPIMSMMLDKPPFDNPDIRLALKFAIDRQQVLTTFFSGYGSLGNDHPIPKGDPYYDADLPQRAHDLDRAKFHYKKANIGSTPLVIQASDAAFAGAVDLATLLQASAAKADIKVDVKKEPADGFWDNVWLKSPFCTSYWGGRPAATQMLAVAYKGDAPWNETHWRNEKFDKLLIDARSELNETKRKEYIFAMQALLREEGGALIPCFRDWIDAHDKKVGGHTPHNGFDMCNGRLAEKAWIKA
jgi:peptide/nickel transport system substrate-binding protein